VEANISSDLDIEDWLFCAGLISESIPNSIISKLGRRFGALYYKKFSEQACSCVHVAKDFSGCILGVIIGTTNYSEAHSIAFNNQLIKLLMAANFRLLKFSVISWLIKGLWGKSKIGESNRATGPAELVVVTVCPQAKGTGIAQLLVEKMEAAFKSKGVKEPYLILTEKANFRANNFYQKIGAVFVKTNIHHGREINQWHKKLSDKND
jgi:GNAT superfamily N-acetyltransferase